MSYDSFAWMMVQPAFLEEVKKRHETLAYTMNKNDEFMLRLLLAKNNIRLAIKNSDVIRNISPINQNAFYSEAIKSGHLKMLKMVHAHYPILLNDYIIPTLKTKKMDLINYVIDNSKIEECQNKTYMEIITTAHENGWMDVVKKFQPFLKLTTADLLLIASTCNIPQFKALTENKIDQYDFGLFYRFQLADKLEGLRFLLTHKVKISKADFLYIINDTNIALIKEFLSYFCYKVSKKGERILQLKYDKGTAITLKINHLLSLIVKKKENNLAILVNCFEQFGIPIEWDKIAGTINKRCLSEEMMVILHNVGYDHFKEEKKRKIENYVIAQRGFFDQLIKRYIKSKDVNFIISDYCGLLFPLYLYRHLPDYTNMMQNDHGDELRTCANFGALNGLLIKWNFDPLKTYVDYKTYMGY